MKNIIICGFMGAGKTVVGRELAKIMGCKFVDTD
ncbi:MAG: shikimate kinase, partial [Eubacterium sp.]|nr:shikimate kinase [Eubacterium sp.]